MHAGSEAEAAKAVLELQRHESGLQEFGTAGRDAVAEVEFYLALVRCQSRVAQLARAAAAPTGDPARQPDGAAAAARAVDVYSTVRYMEHACVPALPALWAVCGDTGLPAETVARVPEAMVTALRDAGLDALALRLHCVLAAAKPVQRLVELLEEAAAARKAPAEGRAAAKVLRQWLKGAVEQADATEAVEWQLRYAGAHLTRTIDAQPDSRVSFVPDRWQVRRCMSLQGSTAQMHARHARQPVNCHTRQRCMSSAAGQNAGGLNAGR